MARRPEDWNSANGDHFNCKSGDLASPDREHAQISALSTPPDPGRLAHVNTIMIQIVPRDPSRRDRLIDADRRGLSALF